MKVVINKKSGFCAGVRNALKMVDEAIISNKYKAIFYLEEIVHNDKVIAKYNNLGLKKITLNELNNIDKNNSLIILSAHGSSDKLKDKLKGFNLLDTTCPFVRKNQELARSNEPIIYIGKKNHSESIATYEDLKNKIIIDELDEIVIDSNAKYTVINQTTYDNKKLELIHSKIISINKNVRIINTLCPTTISNQNSVLDNSFNVLLIVGSKTSNNLNTLFNISTIENKYIIENIDDLKCTNFSDKDNVLIVGSASTDPLELELISDVLMNSAI